MSPLFTMPDEASALRGAAIDDFEGSIDAARCAAALLRDLAADVEGRQLAAAVLRALDRAQAAARRLSRRARWDGCDPDPVRDALPYRPVVREAGAVSSSRSIPAEAAGEGE